MLLIFGLKQVYEDMLKRKDYKAIDEMKYALAFTGPDGLCINPEECNMAPRGTVSGGKKDMLSVM